jgi:hypothetical protein
MKKSFFLGLLCSAAVFVFLFSCDLSGAKDGDGIISSTQFLGRGYDLFSSYADPLEVRGEVLDFNKMSEAGVIEQLQLERADFETIEGETVEEYMSKLSQKVGASASYAGFSGSVRVNFNEDHYTNSAYSFATVKSLIQKYSIVIKAGTSVAALKTYLTDNAKAMLNDPAVDPLTVFRTYGTHVMRGILIGGRLDYSVSANMTEVGGTKSIGVFAELGYEGVFDAEVTSDTVTEEEWSNFTASSSKTLKVYGGSSEYGQYIIIGDVQGYEPWIESIAATPIFCEFDSSEPLIPIWEFCENPVRSQQIETDFEEYAADRSVLGSSTPHQCIVEIGLWDLSYAYSIPDPNPYPELLTIPQDLNEGSGGDFIYLWVKYGLDNDPDHPPITGLHTVNTDKNEAWLTGYKVPTSNLTQLNQPGLDLNKGAGGDYIYLAYSTGGPDPIRSIGTYNTDSKEYYSVPGDITTEIEGRTYSEMDQDLNEDAQGDYIYLRYSYDLVD